MSIAASDTDFRQATPADLDYCAKLYFAAMDATIRALTLDIEEHAADFRARWSAVETRIITRDGADIGWPQTAPDGDTLFLKQLFVDAALRDQGIGTQVMGRLIDEAIRAGRAMTLGVVKTNPALRLYRRLGFAVTHEDARKLYLRRERAASKPPRG
jgi:ribosomal protein S18 acetylase RimI-like enzyme